MAVHALALIAIAAMATAGIGGVVVYEDMQEYELELKVVDAITGEPVANATVVVKDANGTVLATGLTNEDGEYGISIGHAGTTDTDDDQNEVAVDEHGANVTEDAADEAQDIEDDATLDTIIGPLTVTISKTGYETQSLTVKVDTWEDDDLKVNLAPVAA